MNKLIFLIPFILNSCAFFQNTPDELIASKCRLKLPIKKEQCEEVGVFRTKGGQLEGLPVTNMVK